jgi:ubiquinone/menaquinone biosynthesis C-methylase UbiE
MNNHWKMHATSWNSLKSPLRPCDQDVLITKSYIESLNFNSKKKCLLLGVTPEIKRLLEDQCIQFYAVDISSDMILNLWKSPKDLCINADWLKMPFADLSFDLIISDGSMNVVGNRERTEKLFRELTRVLKSSGSIISRFFIRPTETESIHDLLKTTESNFHAFKWRVAMALQPSFDIGIELNSIYDFFYQHKEQLLHTNNWMDSDFVTINSYRNSAATYSFPKLAELLTLLDDSYDVIETQYASYHLAEICPLMLLRKRI